MNGNSNWPYEYNATNHIVKSGFRGRTERGVTSNRSILFCPDREKFSALAGNR